MRVLEKEMASKEAGLKEEVDFYVRRGNLWKRRFVLAEKNIKSVDCSACFLILKDAMEKYPPLHDQLPVVALPPGADPHQG